MKIKIRFTLDKEIEFTPEDFNLTNDDYDSIEEFKKELLDSLRYKDDDTYQYLIEDINYKIINND